MASGTLYTYPDNFRAFKALVAAKFSGAKVTVSPDFKLGETNKTEQFLSKFPLGKVPAFESSNGDCVFESNAIAAYVGNAQLQGSSLQQSAMIQQWINFGDNEVLPASCTLVFPCLGITPQNKQEAEKAVQQLQKAMAVLNKYLATRTFLVGERISQADISLACNLMMAYKYIMDPSFRASYGNVNRWFVTMVNQPEFKSVIGNFQLCTKKAEPDGKKYADLHKGAGGGKEGGKKDKPKKEKEAPKKKEKKKADSGDEDDIPFAKEPKDPFENVPKINMNFDEFKREYSNKDTVTVALPYFWQHFDHENMSLWYCEYKYSNELTKVFMTSNLVGGMFQRLDKLNKNAFASMVISGADGDNVISGVWAWRGQGLVFELSNNWDCDYEYYSWKKLDPKDPETKKLVDTYFSWEGEFCKKPFASGKIFK